MSNSEQRESQPLKVGGIEIPVAEQTPLVLALVAMIQRQAEEIQSLRDEIQRMKGTTVRPKIAPSRLLQTPRPSPQDPPGKRPGSAKRQKTRHLKIDQTIPLHRDDLPEGTLLEDYPHLPLHNNLSENDIREYARLRKISAGTRSDLGRRCRDTFISLKKTCRKLGVSFRAYLHDRLTADNRIPPLTDLMRAQAKQNSPPHTKPLTC